MHEFIKQFEIDIFNIKESLLIENFGFFKIKF